MHSMTSKLRPWATEEFRRLHVQARRGQFWARLSGRSFNLLNLNDVQRGHAVQLRRQSGVQAVPLDRIRGSEGRSGDFDANFRPLKAHLKERWINIAVAQLQEVTMPPVELVQVGEIYYVRDGHHRLSVARRLGQLTIEAEVTVQQLANEAAGVSTTKGTETMLRYETVLAADALVREREQQMQRQSRNNQWLATLRPPLPLQPWFWRWLWPRPHQVAVR
jgi:hypothetical protein